MYTGQLPESSTREDYEFIFQIPDADDNNTPADLTSATLVFGVYDGDGCQRLTGTTADATSDAIGITLVETTTARMFIPRASMGTLCAGSYQIGLTVENMDITKSLIVGSFAVLDGDVPQ